uniref:Uncharacterized protein n=1 Tax=Vannella croatica TaxID=1778588 RepID=A0A2I6SS12_9EUKA|nr:hypothetical protein [Vannella croatica]
MFQLVSKNIFSVFNNFFIKKNIKVYIINLFIFYIVLVNGLLDFLTNNHVYFNTLKNENIKYPRLPHFGFLNDFYINNIAAKEFKQICIPYSSLSDIQSFNLNDSCMF